MNAILQFFRVVICQLQNPLFILTISNGKVEKYSGSVKSSFLKDCKDIVKNNRTQFGIIYGVTGQYGKPILKASANISKEMLQQLRNTYL